MGKKSDKKKPEPAKTESAKPEKASKADKGVVKEKKAAKLAPAAPVEATKEAVKAAPETPKKASAQPKPAAKPKKVAGPTFEEIQLQAYFVAERRIAAGIPGDSEADWIQAEKELLAARKA